MKKSHVRIGTRVVLQSRHGVESIDDGVVSAHNFKRSRTTWHQCPPETLVTITAFHVPLHAQRIESEKCVCVCVCVCV